MPCGAAIYAMGGIEVDIDVEEMSTSGNKAEIGKDGEWQRQEHDDEDEDGLFIPFGWPKQQPRTFYKGSDPEWKEFVKFSKDTKKKEAVSSKDITVEHMVAILTW